MAQVMLRARARVVVHKKYQKLHMTCFSSLTFMEDSYRMEMQLVENACDEQQ